MWGRVDDVINRSIFFRKSTQELVLADPKIWHFPLTLPVLLTTLSHYRVRCNNVFDIIFLVFYCNLIHYKIYRVFSHRLANTIIHTQTTTDNGERQRQERNYSHFTFLNVWRKPGKAEALNKHFSSVFTREGLRELPHISQRSCQNQLQDMTFDISEIEDKLLNLNTNKSLGPNKIHMRLLKEMHSVLSVPLQKLFTRLLQLGCPEAWKVGHTNPVF